MSDELWVSRGESGYGSVVPGTGLPGALLQLLRTSGIVAAYFPWMDVYGRNVGYPTTAGMTKSRMTHTSGSFYETAEAGVHNITVGKTGTAGLYSMSVTFTPIGRRRFMVGVAGVVDTTSVSVISKSAWVDDIAIVANGDGSFTVNSYMDERASQSLFMYSLPDDATGYDDREFIGDVTKGFTLHEWQINFGSTLYPYSAPVGLSQSVVDRTGLGNTVQRGSTSGADTNDPKWSHVSLYFDGVDDVIANEPVADYALYAWGATNSAFGWVSEIPATAGYWFGGIRMSRTPGASEEARLKANIATLLAGQGVTVA